jgi:hypothetical protein
MPLLSAGFGLKLCSAKNVINERTIKVYYELGLFASVVLASLLAASRKAIKNRPEDDVICCTCLEKSKLYVL